MYRPPHFSETRLDVLHGLIRSHSFGLLVSNGPHGPVADPLPFVLDDTAPGKGALKAHLSRANPHWRIIEEYPDRPVLAIFQGAQAYVSPSWYETKRRTGKVVPTWNYAIVQVRGRAETFHDAHWLRDQITQLTDIHESGRTEPWKVTDAPDDFVRAQIRGIVGLRIEIDDIEGKWKMSQNRPVDDRKGVAEGYDGDGRPEMAELLRKFSGLSDG
ncbi:MAG: FMN-binding negative transcriptional regulator [Rhizobiaceae bacterium]